MKQIFGLTAVSVFFIAAITVFSVNSGYAADKDPAPTAKATTGDARIEEHINKLHTTLKITPAQEEQWKNVAQVMRENAKSVKDLTGAREKIAKTMNAVEDLKSYSEIADAHAAGLKKFIPVFETLYAGMSDEQKKNADAIFRGKGHKRSKSKSK